MERLKSNKVLILTRGDFKKISRRKLLGGNPWL
jgi:hypothetical protein